LSLRKMQVLLFPAIEKLRSMFPLAHDIDNSLSCKRLRLGKEMNYRGIILGLLAFIAVAVLFLLKQNNSYLTYAPLAARRPAPDFALPSLDGKMVSLSDYKGHVVLVNIWATWCPPCVDEMPSMENLYKEFKDENFEILAVSIDALGANAVRPFMKKYNLSFPALLDPEATIKTLYQTTGVPESFIVNKEGILVEKVIGPRNWAAPEVVRYFRDLIRSGLKTPSNAR
jgi:peroxiredoxin